MWPTADRSAGCFKGWWHLVHLPACSLHFIPLGDLCVLARDQFKSNLKLQPHEELLLLGHVVDAITGDLLDVGNDFIDALR